MSGSSNDPIDLEQRVGRALRELPLRQAPSSLESRVLEALAQEAARTGWQRGFGRWPFGLRFAFGLISATLAALTVPGASRALTELGGSRALALPWIQELLAVSDSVRTAGSSFTRFVPAHWLYVGLGASAMLYAALLALAIAAYRLLYVQAAR